MAIDHVRVYSGVPAGGPALGVFFTRWVTHFCAPLFVFLAGTSAFFYARKHTDLRRFLFTRGVWLILLELTYFRVVWTFNFDFAHYEMAGVIWVLGWSMIFLAGLSMLPPAWVGAIGVAVIAGHNLLDHHMTGVIPALQNSAGDAVWKIAYVGFWGGPIMFGPDGPVLIVLYSLIPWVGVMAVGYAFGRILTMDPARRDRLCLAIGIGATALFLVLRGFNLYGDPRPWGNAAGENGIPPTAGFLGFLNTSKYPASLSFLLMTLGPAIALIPLLERARGRVADAIALFGRVPFFFYLLHIPLIHGLAMVVSQLRLGHVEPWLFMNHPMGNPRPPDGYAWSLGLLYGVWAIAIALLYPACRWFAGVKARSGARWLRYL
jgi:uncharacterized membrane protein